MFGGSLSDSSVLATELVDDKLHSHQCSITWGIETLRAPTYQCQYTGNLTDISPPLAFIGAHHGSDLSRILGAFRDVLGRSKSESNSEPEFVFAASAAKVTQDKLLHSAGDLENNSLAAGWEDARAD